MAEKSRNASTDAPDDVASVGKVHTTVMIDAVGTVNLLLTLKIFEELRLCGSIPTTVFSKGHISMLLT